jgi:D-arabinose 1-dehydrogenase-like Zn-dependent alcohol dehydrogenase
MQTWNSYRIEEFGQPLRLRTEPVPQPQGTEVLVRITGCGACHTDVHLWDGYFDLGGGRKRSIGGSEALPLTPGHEIAGQVAALGPAASGVRIGDPRVVYPWIGCGEASCLECSRGQEHMCNKRGLGTRRHGGYSDHVLVPHPRYLLPHEGLPAALAATYACAGLTAYSALKRTGTLDSRDRLLLIGAGGVGLWGVCLAKRVTGIAPVVADIDPAKRQAALEFGAAAAIDPRAPGAAEDFLKAGGGAAAAVDFVGSEPSVQFGIGALRMNGKLIIVGLFGGAVQLPIPPFPLLGIAIQGAKVGSLAELSELLALGSGGAIKTIPYANRPLAEASQTLADLKAGRIMGRVVLTPD